MSDPKKTTTLITGIAGSLARLVGRRLCDAGHDIVGVDYRPVTADPGFPATLYRANYNKTRIEDIFRRHHPDLVLHLGRVGNLKMRTGKRFDLNVVGSSKVMSLCRKYQVKRLLVLSTFHIYGAHPHNHTPIYEDEPLRAGTGFPQLGDAIQLDNQAVMWVYRHPEVKTVVLRPCNVVGPQIKNAISSFLRQEVKPLMMGFNPMVQFIHQDDLVAAILAAADLDRADAVGVFNLAGKNTLPWREALELCGGTLVPVPADLAALALKVLRIFTPALPPYMINFTKYPCVISRQALSETFGWEPGVGDAEAILSTAGKLGSPLEGQVSSA